MVPIIVSPLPCALALSNPPLLVRADDIPPGDRRASPASPPTSPVDKAAAALFNNNNNSVANNNMNSKRSMDHVLKKLTFKMMKDDPEPISADDRISG